MHGWMDRKMSGQANEWTDMQYTGKDMHKTMIFPIDFAIYTKALRTNGPTDGRTYPLIEMQ